MALRHEIARAQRSHGRLVFAYLDVDGLKATNDLNGPTAGDALLRGVVDVLRSKLRPYDPIVRVGGDEFVCALSDIDLDAARLRFDQIQDALEGGSVTVA
jgi:diguanylate cyclase (GGDEF)-like protein